MDSQGHLYRDLSVDELTRIEKARGKLTELTENEYAEMKKTPKKDRVWALCKRRGTKGQKGAFGGKRRKS